MLVLAAAGNAGAALRSAVRRGAVRTLEGSALLNAGAWRLRTWRKRQASRPAAQLNVCKLRVRKHVCKRSHLHSGQGGLSEWEARHACVLHMGREWAAAAAGRHRYVMWRAGCRHMPKSADVTFIGIAT